MESIPKNRILKWEPNALNEIRRIHNLDAPGRIEEALAILKDWIQKQEHFVKKDFSLEYLERSLIMNKGSVEKTKRQLDKLCTLKSLLPHFFTCHNVLELQDLLSRCTIITMPKQTPDFYRICLIIPNGKMLSDKSVMEYCLYVINWAEYMKLHDYTDGYILIYDLRKVNVSNFVAKMNIVTMQQWLGVITGGYSARLKAIHLLTPSNSVELLVKLIKQILSQKLSRRLFVHKTIEDLHKVIPVDLLPKDYYGKEKSVEELSKDWNEELSSEEHVKYMNVISKACTNEQLRCTDKFNEECMGMPGSFRNLTVD